jgi:hypothetical protein
MAQIGTQPQTVGNPYVHAILVAITSRNVGTVATAFYNMSVQASSIFGANVSSLPFLALNYPF